MHNALESVDSGLDYELQSLRTILGARAANIVADSGYSMLGTARLHQSRSLNVPYLNAEFYVKMED